MIINLHENADMPENSLYRFVSTLLDITRHSSHSYERTVHRLLLDIADSHRDGTLDEQEYCAILGSAMDVAYYFNYEPSLLLHEQNSWYRASIVHQMGQGMLGAISQMRPDLLHNGAFGEALSELSITRPKTAWSARAAMPITCRQYGKQADSAPHKLLRFPF